MDINQRKINECGFKEFPAKYNVMKTNVRSIILTSFWVISTAGLSPGQSGQVSSRPRLSGFTVSQLC